MSTYFIKLLYSAIIVSGISCTYLYSQPVKADTTKLLASVLKNEKEYTTVVIAANVKYPEILEGHREQSIAYIQKFSDQKRDYLLQTYKTGKKFFPKIIAVLKRYQLPVELKVLIALESGFTANLVSKAGAVGYWQMMDAVATEYGLKIVPTGNLFATNTNKVDERKNITKSTLAAAKYLRDRKLNFNNDVLLMVASYNGGQGTVRNAIKKSRKENPGFWDIQKFLPNETRNYVMNFIALNVIFENYENFSNRKLIFSPQVIENVPVKIPFNNIIPAEDIKVD